MSTELVEERRRLIYVCPECCSSEIVFLAPCPQCDHPPPVEESIEARCDKCYSEKLDRAMPGARERYKRRMERMARKAANTEVEKVNH